MKAKVVIQLLQQNAVGRCYLYNDDLCLGAFVTITRVADDLFGRVVAYGEVLESSEIQDAELDGEGIEILDYGTLRTAHYDGDGWVVTAPVRVRTASR